MTVNFSPTDCFCIEYRLNEEVVKEEVMFYEMWNGSYVFYRVLYVQDDEWPRMAGDPFLVAPDELLYVHIDGDEEAIRLFGDVNAQGDVPAAV